MNNHTYDTAYLDESGDLGGKGSKYLVTALWCTPPYKKISKIINGAKQQLLRKNKNARWLAQKGGEIKFSGFPDKTLLLHTLKKLAALESHVYFVAYKKQDRTLNRINKNTVILNSLLSQKKIIGSMPKKIIADVDYFDNDKIAYCVVRMLKEIQVKDKDGKMKVEKDGIAIEFLDKDSFDKTKVDPEAEIIKVQHSNSKMIDVLQALDLICGAIYANFEYQNSQYLEETKKGKIKVNGVEVI